MLATLVLSGCASNAISGNSSVPKDLITTASQGESGMVFCSIGSNFSQGQGLSFRALGSTAEGHFYYTYAPPFFNSYDIKEGKSAISIKYARLPPGDYELVDVGFYVNRSPMGETTYKSKEKFSIPFKVTANKVTYLGSFMSQKIMGKTIIGFPRDVGAYFVVTDQFDRDFAVLKTKDASVETMSSNKMILDPDAVQLPVFKSKVLSP